MAAVPQKIRTGLVELRTGTGSVYARPSFAERLYLLWMFRHFHSLPRQVLNGHQQRLIDKLCRATVSVVPPADTCVIGVVENLQLTPKPATEALAPSSKLVEMASASERIALPRAVASGAGVARKEATRSARAAAKVEEISATKKFSAPPEERQTAFPSSAPTDVEAQGGRARGRRRWAVVAVLASLALGTLLYLRKMPALPVSNSPVAVEVPPPASPPGPANPVVPQLPPADHSQPTPVVALRPASPALPPKPTESRHRPAATVQPAVASPGSTSGERLQLAQAPDLGFLYPAAPNPGLKGKVSLKAVIGADGRVREVDVLSGNGTLAAAAVRAVRHWRYSPRELQGHAVEAETNITISFVGDDAVSISFPAAR